MTPLPAASAIYPPVFPFDLSLSIFCIALWQVLTGSLCVRTFSGALSLQPRLPLKKYLDWAAWPIYRCFMGLNSVGHLDAGLVRP